MHLARPSFLHRELRVVCQNIIWATGLYTPGSSESALDGRRSKSLSLSRRYTRRAAVCIKPLVEFFGLTTGIRPVWQKPAAVHVRLYKNGRCGQRKKKNSATRAEEATESRLSGNCLFGWIAERIRASSWEWDWTVYLTEIEFFCGCVYIFFGFQGLVGDA